MVILFRIINYLYKIVSHILEFRRKVVILSPKEDTMISREIKKLLQTQKRVTVPSLGSFMRRGDGAILFTDMLKDNDGVLANALANTMAITEQQALEEIARFVLQTERNLADKWCAELTELGTLSRSADGKIAFTAHVEILESAPIATAITVEPVVERVQTTLETPVTPLQQSQVNDTPEKVESPAAQPFVDVTTVQKPRPSAPRREQLSTEKPRRQIDWVLLAAVAAAVIALAVMAYGVIGTDMTSTIILE